MERQAVRVQRLVAASVTRAAVVAAILLPGDAMPGSSVDTILPWEAGPVKAMRPYIGSLFNNFEMVFCYNLVARFFVLCYNKNTM